MEEDKDGGFNLRGVQAVGDIPGPGSPQGKARPPDAGSGVAMHATLGARLFWGRGGLAPFL